MRLKQCPRCPCPRPETDFYRRRASKDGLTTYCKEHVLEIDRESRAKARGPRATKSGDGSIDVGLYLLALATPRGVQRSQREIAYVCGCTHEYISQLEQRALRKLKNAIRTDRRFRIGV